MGIPRILIPAGSQLAAYDNVAFFRLADTDKLPAIGDQLFNQIIVVGRIGVIISHRLEHQGDTGGIRLSAVIQILAITALLPNGMTVGFAGN